MISLDLQSIVQTRSDRAGVDDNVPSEPIDAGNRWGTHSAVLQIPLYAQYPDDAESSHSLQRDTTHSSFTTKTPTHPQITVY